MGWLSIIGQLLGIAPSITAIANKIADTKVALAKADNDAERTRLQTQLSMLQARADVLVKEGEHTNANVWVRIGLAFPVLFIMWKLIIWDKGMGEWTHGSTDPLSPQMWEYVWAVTKFYFLYEGGNLVINAAKVISRR